MLNHCYRVATELAAPLLGLYLRRRLRAGKEHPVRFPERQGSASLPRPSGRLVWFHAASVGEVVSILSLIDALRQRAPAINILVTTGTVTSADLFAQKGPAGVLHQFIPVDRSLYVERFLDHWKPDLALWIESELWPNMLGSLRRRKVPTLLINGRLSERSFKRWQLARGWIASMLRGFALCLAQTETEAERFRLLGAPHVDALGNLKYAAAPLAFDPEALATLQAAIGNRPVWLIASTHAGEDEIAFAAHQKLAPSTPDLLTIIVPRHTARATAIAASAQASGLTVARRALNEPLAPTTNIYLADTMGELGLFYRAVSIVCMGGSFVWGGHNPIEPAQLDNAILYGPRMDNFAEIAASMEKAEAAWPVKDAEALGEALAFLLKNPSKTAFLTKNASAWALEQRAVLGKILKALEPWIQQIDEKAP